jgi:hypothetical protein
MFNIEMIGSESNGARTALISPAMKDPISEKYSAKEPGRNKLSF